MSKQYETVIGLEVHVELATKTKIFCGCSTAFGGAPNAHTCPVCTGMPGSLPVLNRQVVEYAAAVGLATNCAITQNCKFDRKNYFYPDNPQNYQISQLYEPICRDGFIEIETEDGGKKNVGIHEIHMEEDAGKLVHDDWEEVSSVDFNRSGVPLIEIVSEPDLPPVIISDEWLLEIKSRQPELRTQKLERYEREYEIPRYDAEILTNSKRMADLFEATVCLCGRPKKVSNWLMVETMRLLKEHGMEPEDLRFSPEHLADLIMLADAGEINSTVAKEVFEHVFAEDADPKRYVQEHGLKTVNDESALRETIAGVIADNPQSVEDYRNGKEKAIDFLVGQTMKAMKGKANPGMVNRILKELL